MFINAKNNTLKIGDTYMDYATFGKGSKPLIMIPGLSTQNIKGTTFFLAYMYRIFAKEYSVYVFDRKAVVPEEYTVRDIAKDVAFAMDSLGITDAYVFGISQGGMIAQYLAVDRPELVQKLVLGVTLSKQNETVKLVVEQWIEMAQKDDKKAFVIDMMKKMYSDTYIKRYKMLLPLLAKLQKPKDVKRFIILAKACLTCDIYDELNKIKCPVFVIGGRQDKVVTGEASEEIADKLKCEIYMYDNLGHSAYDEGKDYNKRVLQFLTK